MKIAIAGYGVQGKAAYEYWNTPGNQVVICDQNEQLEVPPGIETRLGPSYLEKLQDFDLIIRSPFLHPRQIIAAAGSASILDKVTTVTDEFLRVCPTKNIIGITGTKGKGTTSTLTAKMLEAAGKKVHLGGNIGIPPLAMLSAPIGPNDWVVLELANFQLFDLRHSPHIAACLMIVPEHLNWHTDMEEYIRSKMPLFRHQTPQDIAIYYADNEASHRIASESPGAKIAYYAEPGAYVQDNHIVIDNQRICEVHELKLLGQHNWQNICAATTIVWQVVQDIPAIRSVLTTFSGLEHRLELVRTVDGVRYYDDSFGTTPETAIVALQAFAEPKVVILGGSDKGADFDELASAVIKGKVRRVISIGETAPAIEMALEQQGFTAISPGGNTMSEIVQAARTVAKPGDVVLLSTGCASFDMFENYKDRGEQFHQEVGAL